MAVVMLAGLWPAPGLLIILELAALGAVALVLMIVLRELTTSELRVARNLFSPEARTDWTSAGEKGALTE